MDQLTVGQFKAKFSEVLQKVQLGTTFSVTYGKNKKNVAVLIPFKKYAAQIKPKLGLLEGKASFKVSSDFKLTDEEFLHS